MINLLPPEYKIEVMYARRNVFILHKLLLILLSLLIMASLIFGGEMFMKRTLAQYNKNVENAKTQLALQNPEATQAKLTNISDSVKLAIQVLSKEILFSKLIKQLGSAMPANTVLKQLQIDKVDGAITLQAQALDITSATQLQINLQDPANKIFEKADIENIVCSNALTEGQIYPCSVQIKALFAKDNPFLFINKSASVKP